MTGDVCGEVSVLLHVWIKSGCLNGMNDWWCLWWSVFCCMYELNLVILMEWMTADVCGEVSVLLHVWIKSGCLGGIMTGDVL